MNVDFDFDSRPKKPRDSQRQKLYDAELKVFGDSTGRRPVEDDLATVAQMQAFVDKLMASAWWARRWPRVRCIEVRPGFGHSRATGSFWSKVVQMPKWARSRNVLVHEIAHCVSSPMEGGAHGWFFASNYLDLVEHVFGKATADELRASFKEHRVKYTAPRAKRVLTSEEREVLVDRLAQARLQRSIDVG